MDRRSSSSNHRAPQSQMVASYSGRFVRHFFVHIIPYKRKKKATPSDCVLLSVLLVQLLLLSVVRSSRVLASSSFSSSALGAASNDSSSSEVVTKDQLLLEDSILATLGSQQQPLPLSSLDKQPQQQQPPASLPINISLSEYAEKYEEFQRRVQRTRRQAQLRLAEFYAKAGQEAEAAVTPHHRSKRMANSQEFLQLQFDLSASLEDQRALIDTATIRLWLARRRPRGRRRSKKARRGETIKISIFQLMDDAEEPRPLDARQFEVREFAAHREIRLDVSEAVSAWARNQSRNLGLQVHCGNCLNHSVYIVHESTADGAAVDRFPALDIAIKQRLREKRKIRVFRPVVRDYRPSKHAQCSNRGDRCCRHSLDVPFSDLPGLEFVIQPKVFDAGYCEGNCPTGYNTASRHAALQGRLHDSGKYKVPRPCCVPAVLSDVDVLHVDENDPTKLKVTTLPDMRVLECACA